MNLYGCSCVKKYNEGGTCKTVYIYIKVAESINIKYDYVYNWMSIIKVKNPVYESQGIYIVIVMSDIYGLIMIK